MTKRKPRPRKSICYLYLDYGKYGIFCRKKAQKFKRDGSPFWSGNILTNACSHYIVYKFKAMVGYAPEARDRYKITIERIYQKPKKRKG